MTTWNTTTPGGYTLQLEINVASQSIANNTSTLNYALRILGGGSTQNDFNNNTSTANVKIGTGTDSWSGTYNMSNKSSWTVISGSTTRTHKADGTLSLAVSGTFNDAGSGIGDDSVSDADFDLPTIPRASNPSFSDGSIEAGQSTIISTNRASTAFTHDITYKFGTASGTVANDVGASYTWTPPLSILSGIPNAVSGTATLTTKTYNGTTLVGSHTDTITISAPASVVPTLTDITITEANAAVTAAAIGGFVQNQSKLALGIVGAAGIYGSTITNYHISAAGQSINAVSGTTPGAIDTSGTVSIIATITDSRGRTASRTETITVLPWAAPKINTFSLQRASSTGVVTEQGTYVRININATISALTVGTQKNTGTIKVWSRLRGATTWTDKGSTAISGTTYNGYVLVSPYPIESSYEFKIDATDKFATSSATGTTATSTIFMHWADAGMGVGKFWEAGTLDVAGEMWVDRLRVRSTADAAPGTPGSTLHGLQIGPTTGPNIEADDNEIIARNNGPIAPLYLGQPRRTADSPAISATDDLVDKAYVDGKTQIASGRVTVTPAGTYASANGTMAYGEVTVTFPVGRFTAAPAVVATSSSSSNVVQSASSLNVTTTGATISLRRGNTTATGVDWIAINA